MGTNDDIETPALRVSVWEHGHLVSRVLCESEDVLPEDEYRGEPA
jgi:hypothetical protein